MRIRELSKTKNYKKINSYKTKGLSHLICTPKVRQTFGGAYFFMSREKKFNTRYSPEFKMSVILDMRENHFGYAETIRKYNLGSCIAGGARRMLHRWERIYLEEGVAGFYIERRGRTRKVDNPKKGRPRKKPLDEAIENDLIAENQRLKEQLEYAQMEIDYLKKLDALVRRDEQLYGKKRKP